MKTFIGGLVFAVVIMLIAALLTGRIEDGIATGVAFYVGGMTLLIVARLVAWRKGVRS